MSLCHGTYFEPSFSKRIFFFKLRLQHWLRSQKLQWRGKAPHPWSGTKPCIDCRSKSFRGRDGQLLARRRKIYLGHDLTPSDGRRDPDKCDKLTSCPVSPVLRQPFPCHSGIPPRTGSSSPPPPTAASSIIRHNLPASQAERGSFDTHLTQPNKYHTCSRDCSMFYTCVCMCVCVLRDRHI